MSEPSQTPERRIRKSSRYSQGPLVRRSKEFSGLTPQIYEGFSDLESIELAMTNTQVPDFSLLQTDVVALGVDLPDDPMHIGLEETSRLFRVISDQKQVLLQYRSEAMAIQMEWKSLKVDLDYLLAGAARRAKQGEEYKACRNAEERKDFIDSALSRWGWLSPMVELAILRCTAFIEVCRKKGQHLDAVQSALERQVGLLGTRVQLHMILPIDLGGDGER